MNETNIEYIPKGTSNSIVEKIIGFNKWMKAWGEWHLGKAGRPDCIKCEGRGVYHTANGDDYNVELCECHK